MRQQLWLAGLSAALCGPAVAKEPPVRIDYMLPATSVAAGVQQRIAKCPAPAEVQARTFHRGAPLEAEFTWKAALVAKQTPKRLVSLDTETGFLVDRETKVHFADDWYLKDFNGKTTGQGGALAVSLVKAGASIYAMSVNPIVGVGVAAGASASSANKAYFANSDVISLEDMLPLTPPPALYTATRWYVVCTEAVERNLAELAAAKGDVAKLEARVVGGDGSPATQELLALRRAQVTEAEAKLTITVKAAKPLVPAVDATGKYSGDSARIPPVDISPWFRLVSVTKSVRTKTDAGIQPKPDLKALLGAMRLPGIFGYQVTIKVDETIAAHFGCKGLAETDRSACWSKLASNEAIETRSLVYTRPIPASVKLYPFSALCAAGATCAPATDWPEGDEASGSLAIKLPQLSRLYSLRTGGSIFGGRTVAAEFGAMGEPTMLQYSIGSSSKDAAGLLDASISAAQTVRDADNTAIKRRLDAAKNRKDLEALLEEDAATGATP